MRIGTRLLQEGRTHQGATTSDLANQLKGGSKTTFTKCPTFTPPLTRGVEKHDFRASQPVTTPLDNLVSVFIEFFGKYPVHNIQLIPSEHSTCIILHPDRPPFRMWNITTHVIQT